MCKPQAHIFPELVIRRYCKCLPQPIPIIFQHLHDTVFLIQRSGAALIINRRIKHCRYHQIRHFLFHQPPIPYRFRDTGCSKYRMELATTAVYKPLLLNIRNNPHYVLIRLVLLIRNEIFNALYPLIANLLPVHFHLGRVHPFVEDLLFLFVLHNIFYRFGLGFFQGYLLTELIIVIYLDHIRIKAKDILIPDAIRKCISMDFTTENSCGRAVLFNINVLDRRTGKSENNSMLEGIFYCR